MILKVTPKEALKTIASLLIEAVALRRDFNEEYWTSDFERVEELLKDPEKFLETAGVRAGALPSLVERLDAFKKKTAQALINTYDELATPALFLALDRKVVIADIPKNGDGHYFYAEKRLDLCIDFLEARHTELLDSLKSPLRYLQAKAQILYFDAVCQLEVGTLEADVTRSVMELSVGEYKEFLDIFDEVMGETEGPPPKRWAGQIKNIVNAVNRKTNAIFGFQIFTTKKNTVSVTLPSQIIKSLRQ